MALKKFQMYVNPETDPRLWQFIEGIERSAPNKKGYVVDQIKEILRAWSGLVDIYGERDVLTLALQLASNSPPKPPEVVIPEVGEREEVKTETGTSGQQLSLKGKGTGFTSKRFKRGE